MSSFLVSPFLFWPFLAFFSIFSIAQYLQLPATSFGVQPTFSSVHHVQNCNSSNICHRFFCIVIIYNFLVFLYAIIFNRLHNAIYFSTKHDYYHFFVGVISNIWSNRSSSTWGTITWPYTLSNVVIIWKNSFNMFLHSICFSKHPFEFLFPFSGVDLQ